MARILCTYEFGAGLGHLNRLLPVARLLAGQGHEIVFFLPSPDLARPVVDGALPEGQASVLPGLSWPAPRDPAVRKVPTHNLADVIRLFGFHERDRLEAMAREWAAALDRIRPDLILADFAPTLRIANVRDIPTVVVGNGYTVPPQGRDLPPLRPWEKALPDASREHEAEVLDVVNQVRRALGGAPVAHFADLFGGERTFVCTIPEFDPYGPHRTEPVLVPFNVPEIDAGPPLDQRQGPLVFVYLAGNHPALRTVLQAIAKLDVPAQAYVSGMPPEEVARLAGRRTGIHRKPAPLKTVLPAVRLVVHHAGLATAYAGLLAGTPQFVLPLNLEHSITARGLIDFGTAAGRSVSYGDPAPDLEGTIRGLLGNRKIAGTAGRRAVELAARGRGEGVAGVAEAALALL